MVTKIPAYRLTQAEIKRYIEAHHLKQGDRLPPENKLAEDLGISRPSLREAVKALESLGIIESRHGDGIFVKPFSFDSVLENLPYSMISSEAQITDLLYVRTFLEIGAIPSVLRFIQPENIRTLRSLADSMMHKASLQQSFAEEDRAFHAEMYRCLDNQFLLTLIDLFRTIFNSMYLASGTSENAPWAIEATAKDRTAIVDMLESRNEKGLLQACTRHFDSFLKRYPKVAA